MSELRKAPVLGLCPSVQPKGRWRVEDAQWEQRTEPRPPARLQTEGRLVRAPFLDSAYKWDWDWGGDGWMASPTRWMWVWVSSGSWWWTGRPGVLQFMGSRRVGHDWATELNWTEPVQKYKFFKNVKFCWILIVSKCCLWSIWTFQVLSLITLEILFFKFFQADQKIYSKSHNNYIR